MHFFPDRIFNIFKKIEFANLLIRQGKTLFFFFPLSGIANMIRWLKKKKIPLSSCAV